MKFLLLVIVILAAISEITAKCTSSNFAKVKERRVAAIKARLAMYEKATSCEQFPTRAPGKSPIAGVTVPMTTPKSG